MRLHPMPAYPDKRQPIAAQFPL